MPVRIDTPMLLPRLRDSAKMPEPSVRYCGGSVENASTLTGVNRKPMPMPCTTPVQINEAHADVRA